MRKPLMAVLAVLPAVLLAAAGPAEAQNRKQIRIVGSSTVYPFVTSAAERFGRTTDHPTPVIEATGTGGGLKLFCAGLGLGHPDIANASRRIKQSELDDCRAHGVRQVTEVKIGYDGVVVAASRQAEPLNLTREQLFRGLARWLPVDGRLVENPHRLWSDVDPSLPERPIRVYGPPPTSGTRDAFVELVMEEACEPLVEAGKIPAVRRAQVCSQMRDDGAYVEAGENDNLIVQKLDADPESIGIFGYSFLEQNADRLLGAHVDGVEPSFENIASGEYPVSRSLYIYVKNAHAGAVPGIPEFLAELTSNAATGEEGYLADKGLVPLPEDEQRLVREQALGLVPVDLGS
jgi:phosphate transport system substrate-binding protein